MFLVPSPHGSHGPLASLKSSVISTKGLFSCATSRLPSWCVSKCVILKSRVSRSFGFLNRAASSSLFFLATTSTSSYHTTSYTTSAATPIFGFAGQVRPWRYKFLSSRSASVRLSNLMKVLTSGSRTSIWKQVCAPNSFRHAALLDVTGFRSHHTVTPAPPILMERARFGKRSSDAPPTFLRTYREDTAARRSLQPQVWELNHADLVGRMAHLDFSNNDDALLALETAALDTIKHVYALSRDPSTVAHSHSLCFPMLIQELPFTYPACEPDFLPPVDHAVHSGSSKTKYYVVAEGWVPAIYTDSQSAEGAITGYSSYTRVSCPTKETALTLWAEHCREYHGTHCPNAPPTYWGVKNHKIVFRSRADAIQFAEDKGLMWIHLFGSVKEREVKVFLGMP
ncbi:hypothetical protein R3P38DRAFT_3273441 [Favolaschia claudopus]|uniref:Uncharacterized protein n=1 Tax=Favolaschia claudopus TaxID=2862362 RepID=A0AAW0B009_9AGAR